MCSNFRPLGSILLTPAEAGAADAAAEDTGIPLAQLMEQAGRAVAASALRNFPGALRFIILCGGGNNGGDGVVAAGALIEAGAAAVVYTFSGEPCWKGAAQRAFERYRPALHPLAAYLPSKGDVIIDAVFGAGLSRDVPDELAVVIEKVEAAGLPVLAVDLPSGIDGLTGAVRGAAFQAQHTVTFMARKPGHVLMPGRGKSGEVEVVNIGMPERLIRSHARTVAVNQPEMWLESWPMQQNDTHKYKRGHLAVLSGGPSHSGAARMAAGAGLSAGAGLVTVAASTDAVAVNAATLTAVMVREVNDTQELDAWLHVAKLHAFVIGPGFGVGQRLRDFVARMAVRPMVLDADAITSFTEAPDELFSLLRKGGQHYVLTPHEGEFARLFPDVAQDRSLGKLEKAQLAARRAGAAIIYKGADTVIASQDGRLLINENAPPWLATAGSGDVLAGIVGAHLAQGMPAFEAAACAVWLHGEAAQKAGQGMTAEDLIKHIPAALSSLTEHHKASEARARRSAH